MNYLNFFVSDAGFRSIDDVKAVIKNSKNYKSESVESAKILNFFKTSKQKSYLVFTDEMVYCIVDDVRKSEPKVNWSENKSSFKGKLIETKPRTEKTGLVNFGDNHKNWLYTKSIFSGDSVEEKVSEFLSETPNI